MTKRDRSTLVGFRQDADEESNWKVKILIIRYRQENMPEIIIGEVLKGYKYRN